MSHRTFVHLGPLFALDSWEKGPPTLMYSWQAEIKSMAVFSRLSFCRYLVFIQSNADLRARMCDVAVCIINEWD